MFETVSKFPIVETIYTLGVLFLIFLVSVDNYVLVILFLTLILLMLLFKTSLVVAITLSVILLSAIIGIIVFGGGGKPTQVKRKIKSLDVSE